MFRTAHVVAWVAILGACATFREDAPLPPGGFELSGRISVRSQREAASGRIFWRHSDESDDLSITTPLGQGIAQLSRERGVFRLAMGEGRVYTATDPESLTEEALGWRLPLEGLHDWVQGRLSPGRGGELRRDENQLPLELHQEGWRVDYEGFRDAMPARLRLTRADLQIRLIVDRWVR